VITNYSAGKDPIKRKVVEAGFFALGRTLQSASRFEPEVMKESEKWPIGFSFSMDVLPNGPSLAMEKRREGLVFLGLKKKADADLVVDIKNLSTAYRMIITEVGAHHVFAEHKIGVKGSIAESLRLIRMIYVAQGYLFPGFLSRNVLKAPMKMDLNRQLNRLKLLTRGLVLGQ